MAKLVLPASGAVNAVTNRVRSRRPIVSFVHDDCKTSCYNDMLPLFNAKGIAGTLAIPASYPTGIGTQMSVAQVNALIAAGWDVMSHGNAHKDLETCTPAQLTSEIITSRALLEANGWTIRGFASPYGNVGRRVIRDLIMANYEFHRAISYAGDMLYNIPIRPDYIGSRPLDDDTLLTTYKSYVDNVIANRGWLVLYFHETGSADVTTIGSLIDYIQAAGIDILNMGDAWDELQPYVSVGDGLQSGVFADEGGLRVVGTLRLYQGREIEDPVFTGTGLDDMHAIDSTYTGTGYMGGEETYTVQIDGNGTPDTFKWSLDGGSTWGATGVAITGAAQVLVAPARCRVLFRSTTGHTVGDKWTVRCHNPGAGIEMYNTLGTKTWSQPFSATAVVDTSTHDNYQGTIWFVDAGESIASAISSATAGDVILLGPGTHTLPTTYTTGLTVNKAVALCGMGRGVTKVVSTNAAVGIAVTASSVVLRDFSLSYAPDSTSTSIAISVAGASGAEITGFRMDNVVVSVTQASTGQSRGLSLDNVAGVVDSVSVSSTTATATGATYAFYVLMDSDMPANGDDLYLRRCRGYAQSSSGTSDGLFALSNATLYSKVVYCEQGCHFEASDAGAGGKTTVGLGAQGVGMTVVMSGGVLAGTQYDVKQASSAVVTVRGTILVNGTANGSPTYGGKICATAFM